MKITQTEPDAILRSQLKQLARLVQRIPAGRVVSYGVLGAQLNPPVSGYICGRLMRSVGDAPWWRVVAQTGALPVGNRAPELAAMQRAKLLEEGVRFVADRVDMTLALGEDEISVLSRPRRR